MSGTGYVLVYAGVAVWAAGTIRCGMRLTLADVAADVLMTAGWVLVPFWPLAAFSAAVTAFVAWYWWRRRRRRGRLAAYGAKARARIAAMAARMRERPARPALRPVPAPSP